MNAQRQQRRPKIEVAPPVDEQEQEQEEQFLRRMFDAVYAFRFRSILEFFTNMSRRTRLTLLTGVAALVLAVILTQIISGVAAIIEERNRPTPDERLQPPFNLSIRPQPVLVEGRSVLPALNRYEAHAVEAERINPAFACFAAPESETCLGPDAMVVYPMADYIEAFAYAPPVVIQVAPPVAVEAAVDNADGTAAEAAVVDNAEGTAVEAAGADQPESAVEMAAITDEVAEEEVEVFDLSTAEIRMVTARFETPEDARQAMRQLHQSSRRVGSIGNYVLMDSIPVNYFYSMSRGWTSFFWSNGNWIYMISGQSKTRVEGIVKEFPY